MQRFTSLISPKPQTLLVTMLFALPPKAALAMDEIYNANIPAPGQFYVQQQLDYVGNGLKSPEFPGGIVSHRSLNGRTELAYGVTDWWELALFVPFSIQNDQFLSNSLRLRSLFVTPDADQRNFFYGINFQLSNSMPRFSQTPFGMEIRPIIGIRNADYELIVNSSFVIGFGKDGETDLVPAARLARKLAPELSLGVEYYADFGKIGEFAKLRDQQHTLFAVTDFKLGLFNVNLGVGYGLTAGSDRLVLKTIIGYDFPVPGADPADGEQASRSARILNPMARSSLRQSKF